MTKTKLITKGIIGSFLKYSSYVTFFLWAFLMLNTYWDISPEISKILKISCCVLVLYMGLSFVIYERTLASIFSFLKEDTKLADKAARKQISVNIDILFSSILSYLAIWATWRFCGWGIDKIEWYLQYFHSKEILICMINLLTLFAPTVVWRRSSISRHHFNDEERNTMFYLYKTKQCNKRYQRAKEIISVA